MGMPGIKPGAAGCEARMPPPPADSFLTFLKLFSREPKIRNFVRCELTHKKKKQKINCNHNLSFATLKSEISIGTTK